MVILDTSIIIDHLRKEGNKFSLLERLLARLPKESCAISILTIQELYAGKSMREAKREEKMLATIAPHSIIPYDYNTAVTAGALIRQRERRMSFADAAIAGTAIIHKYPLATLNTKDFLGIQGLTLLRV